MADGTATGTTRRGLLLGGGAAHGAFQAGVLAALSEARIEFDAVLGTSVGAVNACGFLLGYGEDLPRMWRESLRELRFFEPHHLLRLQTPFRIIRAIRELVRRYGDVARVRQHATELLVTATRHRDLAGVVFSTKDRAAPLRDDELVLALLASLAIPWVCEEAIVLRGERYVDGALSQNFPLGPFKERGIDEVVLVGTNPQDVIPLAQRGLSRRLMQAAGAQLRRVARVPEVRIAGALLTAMSGPAALDDAGLRVHRLAPEEQPSYGALDFGAHVGIERMLAAGRRAGERLAESLSGVPHATLRGRARAQALERVS